MSELSCEVCFTVRETNNGFITIRSREFFILYDDFVEVFTRVSKEFDNVIIEDASFTYEESPEWLETVHQKEITIHYDPVYTKLLINFLNHIHAITRIIVNNCYEFNKVTSRQDVKQWLETTIREFCKPRMGY